ncbi:hypothetical protein Smp_130510 [Schistosoma mansoni]|uniref:hypothetical protein n=1 Tax=Schistosoma mansoni TaxID=6183 RepID=UPI0001A642CA|nr:hypothetical protein Smp_130510 [Schistosoma mansoni]|eukprot:XP_018646387.1 hypothetical protein Smp_130510 [Schistosoma mansoni]
MSSNYPQSNKDNETCQHDLLLDKQRFKTHNKHNKSNINDNHLKIVSNPITSSLGHNLQRIQLTTATTLSTSGCPMEYARINTTVDIVPSGIQQSKNRSLNAAMVAHLHQLEVRNQRLEKEKISLEHQLAHILKRLTTDQTINKNEHSNNENRGEEQQQNPSFSCINQSEQALVEEKGNIHRYSEKSSLKHAPIACFDDVSDKRSLLESLSGFSLGEYSSLSDAYDDICLNKNPLNDVNDSDLSELFYTEQKTLAHDDRCITNQLITEQSTHKENSVTNQNEVDNKQSFMKFEKEIKQSKEYLPLSPEELLIYRPDDKAHHDDNDNNSESYYNISTSSISPSPKPGIQRRTLSSRMRRVIPTRNERFSSSLSVESYDSSIDSMIINNHEMCDNEQLINLNYYNNMHNQSTSLPVSPVTPKNWISKNDFLKSMKDYTTKSKLSSKINTILDSSNISTLYSGGIRKSIHQQNSSNMRGSNISEVSNPTTFSSNTPQSQNKNSMISINKNNLNNGPPKIHISRKHLYEPKECLQFSDTSLFLHQYQSTITLNQSTIINQPKKVILYTDIHNVRRPTNMSTSINQLICTSLPKNDSLLLLSSGSATTATMSTIRNNIETRPNVSAPVSRKFTYIESMPKIRVEKYFELVLHDKKVYRLRGVTSQETTKWLSLIKNMLRINEAEQILNKYKSQITKEGWLKRVRKGQIAWFWCRLAGFYLIYSLSPQSTVPVGCKNLKNSYIHVIGNQTSSLEREVTQRTNKLSSISTDFHNSAQLLTSSSDSDSLLISLNCSKLNQERQQTIKIWTPEHEPIYLLCPTVEECEQWRDSLIRATLHSPTIIDSSDIQKSPLSSSASSSLKLFENIREIWKQLVNSSHINNLYHSIVSIKEPISKTISTEYTEISLRLFNHLLFLCHPQIDLIENSNSRTMEIPLNSLINSSQWLTLKYLIVKQLIYFCTKYPILKDELYLQLIKQSEGSTFYLQIGNRYKQSLSEVTSQLTSSPIAKLNIPLTNLNNNRKPEHWWPSIAMWECLCLFLAFMLPSDPVVECLQQVFKLYMDPMRLISSTGSSNEIDPYEKGKSESVQLKIRYFTEIAGYAAFCRDTLNRTKLYGGRDQYPSVLEVFTISIRNPNTHVYPFSLPIYLPFGSNYEVVNFHGSSTIQDLQIQIIEKLGFHEISCKYAILFGIYLCLGESVIESKHIYLNPQWKICDIISMHEQFKLEYLFNNNQLKQEQEQSQQQIDSIRIDQISVKLLFKIFENINKRLRG